LKYSESAGWNVTRSKFAAGSFGYERVACITGPLSTTTGFERFAGYRKALQASGADVEESLVRVADFREDGGRAAMRELLDLPASGRRLRRQ
jgi:DNA-binding LacI/PurR family transcriptional regulator